MKYKKYTFENGLRLVTCPMTEVRSLSIGVWIGVGGRHELDALSGVSHYLEHMLFKGTKTRTAADISRAIEGVGGTTNAFTTEEYTCFYVKVMKDHFDAVLDVLADMFRNPAFRSQDIERERGVILEELRMNVDVPSHYVFELLREMMWPQHPLGRMLIGTEETIRALKRGDLVSFKENHYTASNMVISIAGRMDERTARKAVEKKFSFLKGDGLPVAVRASRNQPSAQVKIFKKKTEQTHLAVGIHSLHRNHPDRFVLRLLNAVLGENMSSRLFQEIREKSGLSYDIGSSVERFLDTGSLIISAGSDVRHLPKLVEKVLKELEKLKKTAVPRAELEMAKEYAIGQAALGMEKTSSQMVYMGESELCSREIPAFGDLVRRIRRVRPEDLMRLAQELFVNDRMNLAAIGPIKHEGMLRDIFHLN